MHPVVKRYSIQEGDIRKLKYLQNIQKQNTWRKMISIPKELNPTKESDAKFSKKNHSYQIYYKAILKK